MTVEQAMKEFRLQGFVYNGNLLNFGRKNKNFNEWYQNHKEVKGKIGLWTDQILINSTSSLVFFINEGELK